MGEKQKWEKSKTLLSDAVSDCQSHGDKDF